MIATYKFFTIKSFPLQLIHTGQWKAHVAITWERDGIVNSRSFPVGTDHPTQEDAHRHGINFAQRIIDKKVRGADGSSKPGA